MTIFLIIVAIWLVLGLIGSPVIFIYEQLRVFQRLTVGDVISTVLGVLLGPIVFCMAVSLCNLWDWVIYDKRREV